MPPRRMLAKTKRAIIHPGNSESAMKSRKFIELAALAAAMSLTTVALAANADLLTLSLQPDGLHKAALANGGFFQTGGDSPPKFFIPDLNHLVADSSTIVVATVSKATATLEDQGRYIRTNCQLNVTQAIKGNFAQTSFVEMPGGKYTFSDGSVANQVEPVWKALRPGPTYILFLASSNAEPGAYRVVGASQGVFEIGLDGQHLISYTYLRNDPLSDQVAAGRTAFLQDVESIVNSPR
jgi:hypothetical protein